MTRTVKHIDVLDEPADALIYSTNIMLNCTGGVAACLVARYSIQVQQELHGLLATQGIRHSAQGAVFQHVCSGLPYRKVFHTVPCDGWYDTSPAVVERILRQCLQDCVVAGDIASVAMSALATGYGHLEFEEFLRVADRVANDPAYTGIARIVICIEDESLFLQAQDLIETEGLGLVGE